MDEARVLIGEVCRVEGVGEAAREHTVTVEASSSRDPFPTTRLSVRVARKGDQTWAIRAGAVLDDEALSTLIEHLIDARARMRGDYLRQTGAPEGVKP